MAMTGWFETFAWRQWHEPRDDGEAEAVFISRCLNLRPDQRVLDAPCGAGRIAHPLAKRGIRVVGIDLYDKPVNLASKRFAEEGLPGRFEARDLQDIDFVEQFDAVINWGNGFGYFSDRENADVMQRFASAPRPGGGLAIDQYNRERILRNFRPQGAQNGIEFRSGWDDRSQRYTGTRIVEGRVVPEFSTSQRWYTPAQIRDLIAQAGLEPEAMYGSAGGDSYSRGSHRLIVVARKTR